MRIEELTVGLDWGTHSSKWWYTTSRRGAFRQPRTLPRVIDSTVYRKGESLMVHRERTPVKADIQDIRLKRMLLADPMGADYWGAVRQGIGISLGEAATLVIACLLSDMYANLVADGNELTESTKVNLRYSLPNWTEADAEHNVARQRMFETAVVVSSLLNQRGWNALPEIGKPIAIRDWRALIREVQADSRTATFLGQFPKTFAEMVQAEHEIGVLRWRLAAESSAAGFLPLTRLLEDVPSNSKAHLHWVKLLVVDVGAGSTDSGYFISSRRIADQHLVFNYLPPALTLDYAGEQLTEMLRDHIRRTRRRGITKAEAETLKVSAPDEWIDEPFVGEWRTKIAKSVGEYILTVPDELRLPDDRLPSLKIVLTGGSGVVKGLDTLIRSTVSDALVQRGIQTAYANRTELVTLQSPIADRVDAARRAVSTGSAESDFAKLAYIPNFEKADPVVFRPASSWV